MRIPGRKILRRLLRPVATRLFPGAVVLGYHRIADVTWDPLGIAVGTRTFREQLETLGRCREIVGLGEIVRRAREGEPVDRCAALTFDDGYSDFVDNALPILQEAGAAATVFVATGFTGGNFWWEQVAALLAPGRGTGIPLVIEDGAGTARRFEVPDDADGATRLVRTLCHELRDGEPARVDTVVRQIRGRASELERDPAVSAGVPMSEDQVARLGLSPLVDVGAHTVKHGCLGDMDGDAQRAEIQSSRTELQSLIGGPVTSFSYPNGSYSRETPDLVRQAGFECACASTEGVYRAAGNPFLIPRLWVPDAGGQAFDAWLSAWIAQIR